MSNKEQQLPIKFLENELERIDKEYVHSQSFFYFVLLFSKITLFLPLLWENLNYMEGLPSGIKKWNNWNTKQIFKQ